MSLDELAYWIAFNRVSGIGPVSFKSLLDYYHDDLEAAWRAGSKELAQAGLTQKTIENVMKLHKTSTPQHELEKLERLRINTFNLPGNRAHKRKTRIHTRLIQNLAVLYQETKESKQIRGSFGTIL